MEGKPGNHFGHKHSEETKKRISEKKKGVPIWGGTRDMSMLDGYRDNRLGVPSPKKGTHQIETAGSKNNNWRGQEVGYSALHHWVRRWRGSAFFCEECGLNEVPKDKIRYFQWSNVSGNYLRILEDWKQLCVKCHIANDKGRVASHKANR